MKHAHTNLYKSLFEKSRFGLFNLCLTFLVYALMMNSVFAEGLFSSENEPRRDSRHSTAAAPAKPGSSNRISKAIIIPGLGGGPVSIGASYQKVIAFLGRPAAKESYQTLRNSYRRAKIDPDRQVEFIKRFDYILRYNKSRGSVIYPVFTIFFRHNKVSMLSYSVFPYNRAQATNAIFQLPGKPGFRFYNELAKVKRSLGSYPFSYPDRTYRTHEYLSDGITVMTKYNPSRRKHEAVTIKIYPPMTAQARRVYKAKFRVTRTNPGPTRNSGRGGLFGDDPTRQRNTSGGGLFE